VGSALKIGSSLLGGYNSFQTNKLAKKNYKLNKSNSLWKRNNIDTQLAETRADLNSYRAAQQHGQTYA